ncbi:MAG: hypothetical protein CMJ64_27615 [Planctomycetaceae bacterium]|nr:hypothetical protein [Planctomycetaceae bacterium]
MDDIARQSVVRSQSSESFLHVLNSPSIQNKLSHEGGRLAQLVSGLPRDELLAEELYLTFFSRFPTDEEKQVALSYVQQADGRQQAAEDLAWSMMNSLEFLFNH